MKLRFIFHDGNDSFVGKAIITWTWVLGLFYSWKVLKYSYSHVEVWLPDDEWGFDELCYLAKNEKGELIIQYHGQCFSSTTRGNANGVRFAPASEVLHHPERWCWIEAEVDPERLEVALETAKSIVGKKYDFWALFGFFNPFPVQDGKRWYCSEACNLFAVLCGIAKQEKRISPRRFAYNLAKVWHEPKPLIEKG